MRRLIYPAVLKRTASSATIRSQDEPRGSGDGLKEEPSLLGKVLCTVPGYCVCFIGRIKYGMSRTKKNK